MLPILVFSTIGLLIATLLPMSRHQHWVVRGLDFPRLQIGSFAALLLFAHLFFLDLNTATTWALLAVTAICMTWQLRWVLPYTFLWPIRQTTIGQQN
ncbi:uncharacterized protein Dvar_80280 [Desulfosarcina variabilis str. Montpellier]